MGNVCRLRVFFVVPGVSSLTGTNGKQGFGTTGKRTLNSQLVTSNGCKYVDFVVYSADLLNTGSPQKWAVGMNVNKNSACLVKVDSPATVVILDNIGDAIDYHTGYGAAWLYGSSIYASTNEAKTPELQNVYKFANIIVNSDQKTGTVSFVSVSKSAVTNNNDGLNCPVTASPFNTACPCGNCTKCYVAPPTTGVTATQLQFVVNIRYCAVDSPCATQPVVSIQDFLGATITTASATVCLVVKVGPGSLTGKTCVAAVGGMANFTDIVFSAVGTYSIAASVTLEEGAVLSADSTCVTVTRPTIAGLVFTRSPSTSTGGTPFRTQPVVTVVDKQGDTVTSFTGRVTLTVNSGCGMLNGVVTLQAVFGVAKYTGLSLDFKGIYILTATTIGMNNAVLSSDSDSFTIMVGAATALHFKSSPLASVAGAVFPTQPVVVITDKGGNTVTTASTSVTISVLLGSGILNGTTTVSAVFGVVAYTGLSISSVGRYTLSALFTDKVTGVNTTNTSTKFDVSQPRETSPTSPSLVSAFQCENATLQQPLQLLKPAEPADSPYYVKVNKLSTDDEP